MIGTLVLGSTLSAATLALAEQAPDGRAGPATLRPQAPVLDDARLRFDQPVHVEGRLGRESAPGRRIALQHAAAGSRWRTVATAPVSLEGRYRVTARLRSSGALRVVPLTVGVETGLVASGAAASAVAATPSSARRVVVAARVVTKRTDHDVQAGDAVRVRGTVLPRTRGRRVVVEGGAGGRWHVLARTRTRAHGRFAVRVVARELGTLKLRVRFAGDRRNAGDRTGAGTLQGFRATLASWYALYGNRTACGQTLGYGTLGVAHKTLPCGTLVTIRYGGREVTVPVIDRGPFVGGREWDLTGATARTLGFSGAGVVWSTR